MAAAPLLTLLTGCADPSPAISDAEKKSTIESMYQEYKAEFPDVPEIDAASLMQLQRNSAAIVVDVRTPAEQAVSIIPGAITKEEFEAHKNEYAEKEIVTYCTIGYRSGLTAQELIKEGFHAFNLKGSVLDWAHAGGEFVDAEGRPTRRVHVYGEQWNLLPDGYEPVW